MNYRHSSKWFVQINQGLGDYSQTTLVRVLTNQLNKIMDGLSAAYKVCVVYSSGSWRHEPWLGGSWDLRLTPLLLFTQFQRAGLYAHHQQILRSQGTAASSRPID